MEHNEMVKKLHEKAGIPADEARDALERADWDMLEALIILEKEGKIAPLTASMTTIEHKSAYEEVTATASKKSDGRFKKQADSFFDKLGELLTKSLTHSFYIERKGKEVLSVPVLIMLIITASMFQFVIIALLVGLFLDCCYSVEDRRSKGGDKE
ncbi:MAG: DUF4342 domain-containing protein [Clostridia bacterium]|nr:DUF4342 domain-containing protein [Clostridia bacterium]